MSRTEYSTIANNQTCLPIKKSYQPFKIKINNIFYPLHVSLHVNNSIDFECLNQAKKHKIILFWNKFWASDFFSNGKDEIFAKNKCPVTKCEITTDRSRVNESDFVVVGGGGGELTDLPLNVPSFRPENQRWIFFLYESPYSVIEYNGFNDFSKYNGVFNLTATYRSDSDFLTNFEGTAQMTWEKNTNYEIPYHLKKNKIAAALISNCEGDKSKRIDFINKLRKFIPIDVYGGCGEKKCPISQIRSACKELIANEYKFYFAFENSLCDEYITEKFFGMLKYNIVPVVRGDFSNRYAEFIPKSAYINVFDFNSTEDLASYLLYLNSNAKAYYKYFEWKKYVKFTDFYSNQTNHWVGSSVICDFCIALHLEDFYGIKQKIINNMSSKWWGIKSNCHTPD